MGVAISHRRSQQWWCQRLHGVPTPRSAASSGGSSGSDRPRALGSVPAVRATAEPPRLSPGLQTRRKHASVSKSQLRAVYKNERKSTRGVAALPGKQTHGCVLAKCVYHRESVRRAELVDPFRQPRELGRVDLEGAFQPAQPATRTPPQFSELRLQKAHKIALIYCLNLNPKRPTRFGHFCFLFFSFLSGVFGHVNEFI